MKNEPNANLLPKKRVKNSEHVASRVNQTVLSIIFWASQFLLAVKPLWQTFKSNGCSVPSCISLVVYPWSANRFFTPAGTRNQQTASSMTSVIIESYKNLTVMIRSEKSPTIRRSVFTPTMLISLILKLISLCF